MMHPLVGLHARQPPYHQPNLTQFMALSMRIFYMCSWTHPMLLPKSVGSMELFTLPHLLLSVIVALLGLISHGSSDLAADRAECTDKLIGLAPCLPFVQGEARSPTPDCCTGYKQVTAKSIKCLCVLVKDRDEPSLGLKIDVNSAIRLPAKCDAPTNVSTCTKLLNLPPDSNDAKEFQRLESIIEGKSSSSNANSTGTGAGHATSDAVRERLMRAEFFGGIWTWSLLLVLLLVFGR